MIDIMDCVAAIVIFIVLGVITLSYVGYIKNTINLIETMTQLQMDIGTEIVCIIVSTIAYIVIIAFGAVFALNPVLNIF